ncbi:serine hydrolase-like protein 2 [Ostrinia nubilalis]|uniref:serine hydrolase-like protein 2 n=1 Tax=Ostrinia nubilalis TaxID=29057 RepID=UPI00308238EF
MYKIKATNEWFIDAPWGKIALISWGDPSGTPVLLVHGRQDSAATFIPLLEHLPDSYYYVGMDLPGHGQSDPLPIGPMLTRLHFLVAVEYALRHLNWDQFVFIGHSMGCEQGLFYNRIYPGKITKFIFLDPLPSLQRLQIHNYEEYYGSFYKEYYSKYKKYNHDDRVYTKKKVLEAVMRNRGLNENQAELVLSRNLHCIGEDLYKLAWDKRLKFPAPQNYPVDYYVDLFSKLLPPTLIISASNSLNPDFRERNEKALHLVRELQKNTDYFFVETVTGGHDVHLTDSESVARCVLGFLSKTMKKAKL